MSRPDRAPTAGAQPLPVKHYEQLFVEIEAETAPDTLSRVLEPVVVMQATPLTVSARLLPCGRLMAIRLGLGSDRTTAERLVRRLQGAVTVSSARLVAEPVFRAIPA